MRYAAMMGFRYAAGMGMTAFFMLFIKGVLTTGVDPIALAVAAAKVGASVVPFALVVFTACVRWQVWHDNQVKPK